MKIYAPFGYDMEPVEVDDVEGVIGIWEFLFEGNPVLEGKIRAASHQERVDTLVENGFEIDD